MGKIKLIFKKLDNFDSSVELPSFKTPGSAGMDIRANIEEGAVVIPARSICVVTTGLAVEFSQGYELQVRSRSGLAAKGLVVANSPGTIDSDYRGEIKVILHNVTSEEMTVNHGDRVAQLVMAKVEMPNIFVSSQLSETERGTGGLGSTGIK